MNTKTDGISSGFVAVAWMVADEGGDLEFNTINEFSCGRTEGTPLVRLSDAEAIIAQKDAEILDQCRINGMGAERESALLGKVAQQSAALKMAREALERSSKRDIAQWHNWDFDGDDDGKPPTQLNDPVLQAQLQALAAINEVLKGE